LFNKSISSFEVSIFVIFLLINIIVIANLNCDEKPIEYRFINIPSPTERVNIPQTENITIISNQKPQIITEIVSCNEILKKHFPAEINCTFKEALSNEIINKNFIKQKWKVSQNRIAIPAKNHKIVFQNLRGNSYVFKVSSKRSLLVNIGSLELQADQYYKHPTVQTPCFLVQYNNREIPTYLPDLTLKLLSEWKNASLVNGYSNYDDNMPHSEYAKWQRECLIEMLRLLKEDGAIFYNHKWRVQGGLLQNRQDIIKGLPVRQIIIWRRKGGINFNPGYFLPTYEVIYLITKPKFKLAPKANANGDVWEFKQEMKNPHPAPFPVALIDRIIKSTNSKIEIRSFYGFRYYCYNGNG